MRTVLLLTVIFVACAATAQTATAPRQNSASAAPAIVTTDSSFPFRKGRCFSRLEKHLLFSELCA